MAALIVIGAGKKKGAGMPPPEFPGAKKAAPKPKPRMFQPKAAAPPPGLDTDGDEPDQDDMAGGGMPDQDADDTGKVSRESAHPVMENEHCKDCTMYQADSSSCSKVDGSWQPDDACVRYFKAKGGGDDADQMDMAA